MRKKKITSKKMKLFGLMAMGSVICLLSPSKTETVEAARVTGSHIGTFDGSTTFTTTSRNGINPGLFIEVMDDDGNLTQYESEEGVITIPETKEGAYITQAKLLGKTKYVDQDTGEVLDRFEEGRNLELVSSEMPGLKTSNSIVNNLMDYEIMAGRIWEGNDQFGFSTLVDVDRKSVTFDHTGSTIRGFILKGIPVKKKGVFSVEFAHTIKPTDWSGSLYVNINTFKEGAFVKQFNNNYPIEFDSDKNRYYYTFTLDEDCDWINIAMGVLETKTPGVHKFDDILIYNTDYKGLMSNKTSTLTIDKDVALRGVEDVRDTLDLITGEVVQRIGKWQITATENSWRANQDFTPVNGYSGFNFTTSVVFPDSLIPKVAAKRMATLGFATFAGHGSANRGTDFHYSGNGKLVIESSLVAPRDLEALKQWLKDNEVVMQYELANPIVQAVNLASDYYFQAITNQNVQVNGEVEPLVVSITVPTDALSFTLDPNQEAGQQFIAPDFALINETLAPLQIELKNFEQTTNILNDVLPEAHENWEGLNKKESKDIALALGPIPSDGWLSLNESPRYVANTSDELIGTVKGKSSVEFSFDALHGQAFSEVLNPEYRLSFVFGFIR